MMAHLVAICSGAIKSCAGMVVNYRRDPRRDRLLATKPDPVYDVVEIPKEKNHGSMHAVLSGVDFVPDLRLHE